MSASLIFLPWNEDSCLHYLYFLGILVSNKEADKFTERGLMEEWNVWLGGRWPALCLVVFDFDVKVRYLDDNNLRFIFILFDVVVLIWGSEISSSRSDIFSQWHFSTGYIASRVLVCEMSRGLKLTLPWPETSASSVIYSSGSRIPQTLSIRPEGLFGVGAIPQINFLKCQTLSSGRYRIPQGGVNPKRRVLNYCLA